MATSASAGYPSSNRTQFDSHHHRHGNHQSHQGGRMAAGARGRGHVDHHDLEQWAPSRPKIPKNCSVATLENARYRVDGIPTSDHSNEDRNFVLDGGSFQAFGLFDGHDGPRAAGFASNFFMELFHTTSWRKVATEGTKDISMALKEFFVAAEKEFFQSIRYHIQEKKALQAVIPSGMKSYQAYQLYPVEVARLQELEPKIAGGCTAVIAVICDNNLYIANAGDSRAVLVYNKPDGTLATMQLSEDHGVENEGELRRLKELGLDERELKKAGRLGSQENTRSIGDYYIKEGYKDVDTLCHARDQPGIAQPFLRGPFPIDETFQYLILMTDGIYKSIEAMFDEVMGIDANKVLLRMMDNVIQKEASGEQFVTAADSVVGRLAKIHQDTYSKSARLDPRSPKAVACRKRDDMTLMIYKFPVESSVDETY